MRVISNGTGLFVAGVFLSCGTLLADEKEAREVFDRMEKKLAEADTISVTVEGTMKAREGEGSVKATLLLAQGNKVRANISVKGDGRSADVFAVSDGVKQKSGVGGQTEEKDTPKHLRDNLVYTLSRIGFAASLMQSRSRDESKPQKETMRVSDFHLDKSDEIDGRDVHVLHYKFALPSSDTKVATTLYIDEKTMLPVSRSTPAYLGLKEKYQYKLNEKIDDKKFELPK